jgi:hypothetical protein
MFRDTRIQARRERFPEMKEGSQIDVQRGRMLDEIARSIIQ